MSLSVVRHAAKPARPSVAAVITQAEPDGKCFRQYAPSVVKKPKYRSNLVVIDRSTAAIVTAKLDQAGNDK
jgi:hypothetical protein